MAELERLQSIGNLELLAKQVVEGFITGLHKSPFHGFSVEFAEHRLYNTGESIKHIDWKLYGRTERLYTKRYEEETNLRCQLIIDTSSSMYFPEKENKKLRFSVYAAASLMHLLKKQRDAVGLSLFSDEINFHSDARSSSVHHKLILNELEKALNDLPQNKTTSVADSLHLIAERIHKRSMVIIFSDMMDNIADQDDFFSSLQHLKFNKHEVILFHVTDKKKEQDFEYDNRPYLFVDVETGEKVKLNPREVKDNYVKQSAAFRQELLVKCAQYKIEFVEADVNKGFEQILLPFLVKRQKMN